MSCKLFDTHTHFNFNAFRHDWEEVIERTLVQDVWFVNVGAEAKTSRRAVDIAKKYPQGVFAAVGLHPIHVYDDEYEEEVNGERVKFITRAEEFDKKYYSKLLKSSDRVVAIGETGLDYFHINKFSAVLNKKLKQKQAEVFIEQIKLANELNKPIIIHCRPEKDYDAYKEILEILKDRSLPSRPALRRRLRQGEQAGFGSSFGLAQDDIKGIVHCFQGSEKILEEFLARGFMIGYNGVITFTSNYDSLIKATPLERIVLETDAPWLTPIPHRGKRNESIYVLEVAKKMAELKGVSFEKTAEVKRENAMDIFKLNN